jgi:hypothetical protein
MTKLRIDLFSGILEVDGEEGFVRTVYDDFKGQLLAIRARNSAETPAISNPASPDISDDSAPITKPIRTATKRRNGNSPALIKDLDLSETAHDFSLTDFYAAKSPQNAMESNVVFVYYLQRIAQVAGISINHIYTCYKYVSIKYPNALRQSIADTSSRKNWLDTGSFDNIRLSTAGENFVEHDLPRRPGV